MSFFPSVVKLGLKYLISFAENRCQFSNLARTVRQKVNIIKIEIFVSETLFLWPWSHHQDSRRIMLPSPGPLERMAYTASEGKGCFWILPVIQRDYKMQLDFNTTWENAALFLMCVRKAQQSVWLGSTTRVCLLKDPQGLGVFEICTRFPEMCTDSGSPFGSWEWSLDPKKFSVSSQFSMLLMAFG